jgi:nucleotide-binding universal stress UspA family protein
MGRVVVGVGCSPGSLEALRYALGRARRLEATPAPLHASIARYCLAHAVCPVLAVPPPSLQAELSSARRLRVSTDRLARELTTRTH